MPTPCTVTGNLQTLSSGQINAGAVRFQLSNIGTGNPVGIIGTSLIPQLVQTFATDNTGAFSCSIWGNDNINPANTVYLVTFLDGLGNSVGPIQYSITGASVNLNTAIAGNTTSPPVLIGGPAIVSAPLAPQTITGQPLTLTSAPLTLTNPGVFSNAQMNLYLQSLVNGCSPSTEIGGNANATQAITGCVAVPAGTVNNNSAAVVGFANSLADSAGRTRGNAVGGYFQGRALANNSAIWGINPLATDAQGLTGHNITGIEIDVGISLGSTPSFVRGLAIISSNGVGGVGTPGTNSIGIELNSPAGGFVWNKAIMLDRGVSANGIVIDGNGFGGNNNSQSINLIGYDGGNVAHQSSVNGTSTGNIQLQPDVGGGYFALRSGGGLQLPGSTSGASNLIAPATGGGNQTLPQGNGTISNTIASGTAAMTTALIGTGACGTTVSVSATGVLTTDAIAFSFNGIPPAGTTSLILQSWPTANNVNFQYCNPTAAGITPGAATLNWRVPR